LLVRVPSMDPSGLDLGEGWPDRWLVTRRLAGERVVRGHGAERRRALAGTPPAQVGRAGRRVDLCLRSGERRRSASFSSRFACAFV